MHMTPRNPGMSKRVVFIYGRPVVISVPLRPNMASRARPMAGRPAAKPQQRPSTHLAKNLSVSADGTAVLITEPTEKNITHVGMALACLFVMGLLFSHIISKTPSWFETKQPAPIEARLPDESWDQHVRRLIKTNLATTNIHQLKDRQVECLAKNIYFESRGQPLAGQVGVAKVTLNRLEQGWAKTICGVVYQKLVEDVCQFSWVCDSDRRIPTGYDWRLAVGIATTLLKDGDHISDPTGGATHFHATYIQPAWKTIMTGAHQIGDHVFYRMKSKSQ